MEESQHPENIDHSSDSTNGAAPAEGSSSHSSNHSNGNEPLKAQLKEQENKYLYLYADFENFKKRSIRERAEWIKFGWERIAKDLLGVLDNFDRALQHLPAGTDPSLETGLKMMRQQFYSSLEKNGVKTVESLNKPFDAEFQEAVNYEPSDQPEGTVIKEEQAGYMLHDRLLRPARVVVSKGRS